MNFASLTSKSRPRFSHNRRVIAGPTNHHRGIIWFLTKRWGWLKRYTQQLVNSNLNLPQLLGHCAKFKPSLNPGTAPIEHLGLVDTDSELSHDIEQGFDYARLLPQLEFRLVKLCFLFLAKLIHECTRDTAIVTPTIFLIGIYTRGTILYRSLQWITRYN